MTKIPIIILNYNGGKEVVGCIKSLVKEGKRLKWRGINILVVDNGSSDDSLDEVRKLIKRFQLKNKVKIILNKRNLGFAAGNNVGIKHALKHGAKAVLLLNQDVVVQKGFLKPLLANSAEIVAPVIKFKREGKWFYDFGGRVDWWLGRPIHIEKETLVKPDGPIDYVSGCGMLIRKPVFDKIGLLDEKFFLYFEDVDFCLRASKAGFKIKVEPKSLVAHKLKEKEKKPLKQHFSLLKSNLVFIIKHLPIFKMPIAFGCWSLLLLKTLFNQVK